MRHLLRESHHIRHMREDVSHPGDIEHLMKAEQQLKEAFSKHDDQAFLKAQQELLKCLNSICKPRSMSKWRENLEVLVVALAVAMAFRAYYIQPFKIPTGSMQPTLYGITYHRWDQNSVWNSFPLRLVKTAVLGEWPVYVKAHGSGRIQQFIQDVPESGVMINGIVKSFPTSTNWTFVKQEGDWVERGDVIAAAAKRLGDHIFVDKVSYNFRKPVRGDVIVFKTDGVMHPEIRRHTFYIKRLVGMPGESISIDPPYLIADGKKVDSPYPFKRMVTMTNGGYNGYQIPNREWDLKIKRHPVDIFEIEADNLAHIEGDLYSADLVIECKEQYGMPRKLLPLPVCMIHDGRKSSSRLDSPDGVIGGVFEYIDLDDVVDYIATNNNMNNRVYIVPEQKIKLEGVRFRVKDADQFTAQNMKFVIINNFLRLVGEDDAIIVDNDEYLPMGDNTLSSLDGRYFGGIGKKSLVGPAFLVYWPISSRWGLIK